MIESGLRAHIVVHRGASFEIDIEIDIEPGRTAALLGPNGAGKSTIVDVLAGILPLDDGRVELDARVLDEPRTATYVPVEERGIGVVFQQYLLFEHLDVGDNIAFGPTAAGRSRREATAIAAQWIEALDLRDLAARRPRELSGGQAQRVALARALATEPSLLLLDEPLAALDIATRTQLRRRLGAYLGAYEGPRLLITHDPTDAFLLADQIHVLEDGRITQTGTPEGIRRRPATPYVAALAGVNLLSGTSRGGLLTLDEYDQVLQSADTHTSGAVLITIHPNAIALHATQPHGSPRNAWSTAVAAIEPLGDITRVTLGSPLPLSVDITPGAADALALGTGSAVWASIKATEVELHPG